MGTLIGTFSEWREAEQAARERARKCGERASEAAAHGSAVASREWSEAEHAALLAAVEAQNGRHYAEQRAEEQRELASAP